MSIQPLRPLFVLALLTACAGGGSGDDTDTDFDSDGSTEDDEPSDETFLVSIDVTGLEGREVTFVLDGDEEIDVDEDGEYEFETELEDGDSFAVTVEGELTCPTRLVCRIDDDGEGEIDGEDVKLDVTCGRTEVMLVSNDWSVGALRFVDDLFQYGDGETATARIVDGESTGIGTGGDLSLDSLAVDPQRDLVYVGSDDTILVFEGIDTLEGDVAPVRIITLTGAYEAVALEIDVANDRLYFGDGYSPRFIDDVSSAEGTVDAAYVGEGPPPTAIVLDVAADRLYVAANDAGTLAVWDDVSTITEATPRSRTIDWSDDGMSFGRATAIAIDPCADRAYLGSNASGSDGAFLFVLDDVSTLDGDIVIAEDAAATYTASQAISLVVDSSGWLYVFEDSAQSARVYTDAASWTGEVSDAPDIDIPGAIYSGYGVTVVER